MKAHNMVIVHTHLIIFGRFTTYDPLGHGWVTHKPHPSQTFWTLPGLATSAWFPWRKRDFQGQHSLANSSCHSQPRYNPSKSLVDPILGNSLGVGCSRRRKTWETHGVGLFISFPKGLVVSVFPQFLSHDLQPLIASSRCNSWPEGRIKMPQWKHRYMYFEKENKPWWLKHPSEKYESVKMGSSSPTTSRGEIWKNIWNHWSCDRTHCVGAVTLRQCIVSKCPRSTTWDSPWRLPYLDHRHAIDGAILLFFRSGFSLSTFFAVGGTSWLGRCIDMYVFTMRICIFCLYI